MAVFSCATCGIALTPDLTLLSGELVRQSVERGPGPSTVPRGSFAIDPEPFGAPFVLADDQEDPPFAMPTRQSHNGDGWLASAGPRNTMVIHPEDAPLLEHPADFSGCEGCCGPSGDRGLNLVCPCGTRVATLMADCYGPHELHLDPELVSSVNSAAPVPPAPVPPSA